MTLKQGKRVQTGSLCTNVEVKKHGHDSNEVGATLSCVVELVEIRLLQTVKVPYYAIKTHLPGVTSRGAAAPGCLRAF